MTRIEELPALVVPVALAAALALGCGSGSGKREAMSLIAAVDRYRQAPMASKAAPEDVLEKLACSDPEVCAAREACLASARPTIRGVALKQQVEATLADLQAGRLTKEQVAAMGLAQKLDDASHAIGEGQGNLPGCDAKVTALRLKYAY
jgi:hypothetical protein